MTSKPQPKRADATVERRSTRRTLAKQQTRQKVIEAARQLFSEEGYEGATIRDIAAAAGMSTGAVFANFKDKADLFGEIMAEDASALIAVMRDASNLVLPIEESVLAMFLAGYAFYRTRLQLARAAFSVSWSRDGGAALRNLGMGPAIEALLREQLERASAEGELLQDAEAVLRSEMLFQAYLSNYSGAVFESWTEACLKERAAHQIRILLAGAKAN